MNVTSPIIRGIYRISHGSYPKDKFSFATKKNCLRNFLKEFYNKSQSHISIFVDVCDTINQSDTEKLISDIEDEIKKHQYYFAAGNTPNSQIEVLSHVGGSSAQSFVNVLDQVMIRWNSPNYMNDIIYFVEDDYLHRPNALKVLTEGIEISDYVSLYDHRDKYIPAIMGGNKYIGKDGGETTKVFCTDTCHWKLTNSTTMTFATTMQTLAEDKPIFDSWTRNRTHPNDFSLFLELRECKRSLITPIPGYSTHCEPQWASPLIDWSIV